MPHYVGSWLGAFPPKGRTACGIVVWKSKVDGEAETELNNRIEYVEIWRKVSCTKCKRSTEGRHAHQQSQNNGK